MSASRGWIHEKLGIEVLSHRIIYGHLRVYLDTPSCLPCNNTTIDTTKKQEQRLLYDGNRCSCYYKC